MIEKIMLVNTGYNGDTNAATLPCIAQSINTSTKCFHSKIPRTFFIFFYKLDLNIL